MKKVCNPSQHLSRRALLKGTVITAGGALMNWGSLTSLPAFAEAAQQQQKHCIMLWMNGGASQFETFDMKVGRPTGGLFRPISTNVPGTQICELMPKMSQQMDKIAVVRSMHTSQIDHPGGIHLMHTGYQESAAVRFPELGAVVAKYLGHDGADLPNFIKVSTNGSSGSGFLGPKYQPFGIGPMGEMPPFSGSNIDPAVENRRHSLREFMEQQYAERSKAESSRMHHESYEAARRLLRANGAFKIDSEWEKMRELYGDSLFGRNCLLARRLIESGVSFVEVGQSSYDTHSDNFTGHKGLVPCMEHAWAGLMTDLARRGLLERTLIVWMGEIGRTPSINNRAGRDHFVRCWSAALAGCGIKGGAVYGETDQDGRDVKSNPVTEGDFFATIYQALGINPKMENFAGIRPIPLANFGSKPVADILA